MIFGVLLVSPAFAAWAYRSSMKVVPASEIHAISYTQPTGHQSRDVVRIPIEVIEKGSAAQVIYVEASNQAVPEPGIFSLLAFTSLILVFRRSRK